MIKAHLVTVFIVVLCVHAFTRERVQATSTIPQGRIGVIVTDQFDRIIPASQVPFIYNALLLNGYIPVYLNDVGINTNLLFHNQEILPDTISTVNDNSAIFFQDLKAVSEKYGINHLLFVSRYYKRVLSYNINASVISLQDRSVVAYHYEKRNAAINIFMGGMCFSFFAAPIFWVSFPCASVQTTKRINSDFVEFVANLKLSGK